MRITITRIEAENGNTIVGCKTNIGEFKGIWTCNEKPVIGEHYHAELTIGELEDKPVFDAVQEYQVSLDGENVYFRGMCEGADEEVFYIRFDVDWIEMIDVSNGIDIGNFVFFSAKYKQIKIYPYEL